MNETTISLPDETVNYLQRLDYELAGLQVLHTHALKAATPLVKRMEIRREFQETFAEYQMAKNEMWAEFAPRFPNAARWWVDFQSGELHVEMRETIPTALRAEPLSKGALRATLVNHSDSAKAPFGKGVPPKGAGDCALHEGGTGTEEAEVIHHA